MSVGFQKMYHLIITLDTNRSRLCTRIIGEREVYYYTMSHIISRDDDTHMFAALYLTYIHIFRLYSDLITQHEITEK